MSASHAADPSTVGFDAAHATGVYFKAPAGGVQYYRAGSAASTLSFADAGADVVFVARDEAQRFWETADAATVRRRFPEVAQLVVGAPGIDAVEVGTEWFPHIRDPFPQTRFVATGGMNAGKTGRVLAAGVRVVAAGSALEDPDQLERVAVLLRSER